MERTSVYTYRAQNGRVLYVGMSVSPMVRERSHRASKDMAKVATISLDWFASRESAARHEKEMIETYQPLWNRRHANAGYEVCKSAIYREPDEYDLHVQHWQCVQIDPTGTIVRFSYAHCS